ncbi:septal ring lytic transglycosylase RlpA family protein [Desulfurivibrio dismutans]|uniref:septal ring lytic transglycosylase RlpA family protein n=1 Tax=Desulfurivibrio dismutans TaxID=1398908 RepID=UPI0023D9A64D|nr:septal ring lytic transglycosylase RlpA family protein [Desulfurivibrio alkaliphilus]MDF1613587.1 septal ring lytic transglycosylase RlpA family protein [Desulfurivibrio alkaliphilus]
MNRSNNQRLATAYHLHRSHRLLGALLLLLLALSACGKPPIISSPTGKSRVEAPPYSPAQPPAGRIPPTQRPYQIQGITYYPIPSAHGYSETGIASWYGRKFHGRRTSNGEIYDMHAMTAAHKTLPMDTHLLVENLENGKEITVRINDRGPFVRGRIIDLSYRAAQELGMADQGLAQVRITALGATEHYLEDGRVRQRFAATPDFEHGEFYVQVGAFTVRENAVRLRDQLQEWGRTAVIREYDHGGRLFYRVQVAAGDTLSGAMRFERVMIEAGFTDAFVVAH